MNVRDVIQALGALERTVGRERLEAAARVFGLVRRGVSPPSPELERDDEAIAALIAAAAALQTAPARPSPEPDVEVVVDEAADVPAENLAELAEKVEAPAPKRRRGK